MVSSVPATVGGRTPLIIGKKEGAYAASSETSSFPNLDFETAHEVGPGEIVKITAEGMEQIRPANKKMQVCSFLWVYYGFPTSTYEGKNVEEALLAMVSILPRQMM